MIDFTSWILTLLALYGTWLNCNKQKEGFYYWLVADVGLCVIFIFLHLWPQALLFAIYSYLAVKGLKKW